MPNAHTTVIVGGDGGIGAAYAQALIETAPHNLHNLRSGQSQNGLEDPAKPPLYLTSTRLVSALPNSTPRVAWLRLDLEQQESASRFAAELANQTDKIDTLLIASGVLHQANMQPEKNLSMLSSDAMQRLYAINAAGPLALLSELQALLKNSENPKVIFLSAQVGSIEDNHLGGWYSYRMSKAALNMGIKTAAIETSRWRHPATIVAVHPGTTHTPLSKPFVTRRKAPVQSATVAGERLHRLVARLQPEQTGSFLTLDGTTLPW